MMIIIIKASNKSLEKNKSTTSRNENKSFHKEKKISRKDKHNLSR